MEEDSNNYEPFESFGLEVDDDSNADNSSHTNKSLIICAWDYFNSVLIYYIPIFDQATFIQKLVLIPNVTSTAYASISVANLNASPPTWFCRVFCQFSCT